MVFINLTEINIIILLDLQKSNTLVKKFKKCSKDIKSTWKVINQLLQREKANSELPSDLVDGENYFNDPFDIAQKFNDFFC